MQKITKKLVLVGDGGVGKSNFCYRNMNADFDVRYVPTLGVEVHPLVHRDYNRNVNFVFNTWDTAGQEKFGGLRDGYYIQGDVCIVMCDITRRSSINMVDTWITNVRRVCENIKIVIVANKKDLDASLHSEDWTIMKGVWQIKGYATFEISCKTNEGVHQVIEHLTTII